jgi:hypothetical protein
VTIPRLRLQRTVAWTRNPDNNTVINTALAALPGGETQLTSPQEYFFFSVSGGVIDAATPESINNFKKIPGFGGVVETLGDSGGNGAGDPLPGMTVEIWKTPTSILGSVVTDDNGVYLFEYKHVGKPADYTLKVMPPGLVRAVRVKSNSFNLENFEVPSP